jgi:hypothetical protein
MIQSIHDLDCLHSVHESALFSGRTVRCAAPSISLHQPRNQLSAHTWPDIWLSGLAEAAASIDWDAEPQALVTGNLSSLKQALVRLIKSIAVTPKVRELAKQLQLDPVVVVIALLARHRAEENRSAARLMRAVLGDRSVSEIDSLILG